MIRRHYPRILVATLVIGQTPIARCAVEGCWKDSEARDLCRTHYSRWAAYGDPLAGPVDPGTPDRAWMVDALCSEVGDELFFPEQGENYRPAIKICGRCEVMDECLEYALATKSTGVWGGTTDSGRERIAADRNRKQKAA